MSGSVGRQTKGMGRLMELGHRPRVRTAITALLLVGGVAMAAPGAAAVAVGQHTMARGAANQATVWLCRPGLADDPCTANLAATVISSSGSISHTKAQPSDTSRFDCFYVYPTASRELAANADLKVQPAETAVAVAQASRFSSVCRVYAPMYRQVTLSELALYPNLNIPAAVRNTAEDSLFAGFADYLAHYNDGRPIVFIGHSQGAAVLIALLARMVDSDAALRNRLVLAVILGGDVEVRPGSLVGGSFTHIPVCSRSGESGCVIAYSTFPGTPPSTALFGRPGQGVALQSGQSPSKQLQVVCVNPAAEGGGTATLDSYFPSLGTVTTPWVTFPSLYRAQCETSDGAAWLQITKATGPSDPRPILTEADGPDWGYHAADVNVALGNLIADVQGAESSWTTTHH